MKKMIFLFTVIFSFNGFITNGQIHFEGIFNFEIDDNLSPDFYFIDCCIEIDTITNNSNIWQIGAPQKTNFDSAYPYPYNSTNAMCTDLTTPYPVNDTSIFYIKRLAGDAYEVNYTSYFWGHYKVDTDSLKDYGKIEMSVDEGDTWLDICNPIFAPYWDYQIPSFTGNSNGWKQFQFDAYFLGQSYGVQHGDILLYKFTFISDSIQTNQDGWMLDAFYFVDTSESVEDVKTSSFITNSYPNPSNDILNIELFNNFQTQYDFSIYDLKGNLIQKGKATNDLLKIDTQNFTSGIYFYTITNNRGVDVGRFVKN